MPLPSADLSDTSPSLASLLIDLIAATAFVYPPGLVSHRYGLPDALVRTQFGDLIPVERKKSRAPQHRPYDGDLIQATAYCVLVEEEYWRIPPFMRIHYAPSIERG